MREKAPPGRFLGLVPAGHPARVVHLELHTRDLEAATTFYGELLGWRTERIASPAGCYHALLIDGLDGGIVECETARAGWLPYVEVARIEAMTERARGLGGSVLLGPREGPAGWRAVVSTPAGGEIALWQQKKQRAWGSG
jgi:predicted enzyme related to lactoylglutathione lyase